MDLLILGLTILISFVIAGGTIIPQNYTVPCDIVGATVHNPNLQKAQNSLQISAFGIDLLSSSSGCQTEPVSQPLVNNGVLTVSGNHFVDKNGNIVVLKGASNWELEFGCNPGGHYQLSDFQAMRAWNMNAVRFNLNSSSWLSGDACASSTEYQTELKTAVANAKSAGLFVMLDLQWLGAHTGQNEQMLYPQDRTFWSQVAAVFASDFNVAFVPSTEPHDITYSQWYNGWNNGPGMKEIVSLFNAVAPNHIIFVNGINWGNDLSFLPGQSNAQYAITGSNIAYEVHIYGKFTSNIDAVIANYPIVAGEFGVDTNIGSPNTFQTVMNYFQNHQTGYFAWAWTTSGDSNVKYLLNSWLGTPRQNNYGNVVNAFMLAH